MHGLDEALQADDFDVFAIGGLITSYNYIKAAVKRAKEIQPHIKVVVGGGFFSAIPSDIMELMPEIDYGCVGEAYETFPDLLRWLGNKQAPFNLADINGLVYRGMDKELRFTSPRQVIPNLDWLPFPAYKYAPLEIYFKHSGILLSETSMTSKKRLDMNFSLSCSLLCKFCWDLGITSNRSYHPDAQGTIQVQAGRPGRESVVRQHSPQYIGRLIEHIRKDFLDYEPVGEPVDFILWTDENVIAHDAQTGRTWLKSIEEELWKRDLIAECLKKGVKHNPTDCSGLHYSGTSHAGIVTKDALATMKRIGFSVLDYGLETWSREIMTDLGKGSSPERNAMAIRMTLDAGMQPIPNQIIMFPLETWNTIYEMLDAWEKYGIVTVPFICTPYPGSQWYEEFKPFILEQYGGSLNDFLADLQDATSVSALINRNFSVSEALGIQAILGDSAKSQDFVRARRLLQLSEKEWLKRRS